MARSDSHTIFALNTDRQKKRKIILISSIAGGSLLLICGIVYFLFFSSFTRVRSIEFVGNRVASDDELKQLLIKKLDTRGVFMRMFGHDNIFYWMSAGVITETGIPAAESLDIRTDSSSRVVTVTVDERKFMGVWCGDTCVGFDSHGLAYFYAPDVSGSLLLKIEDENHAAVSLGDPVMHDDIALENIFATLRGVRDSGTPIAYASIKDLSVREWEIVTSGPVLKLSLDVLPQDIPHVLQSIREKTDFDSIGYIDMRVKNRVYYR